MTLPEDIQVTAPHIYSSPTGMWIVAGPGQVIQLSPNIHRALILCPLVYYIKNLIYPFAFSQMLFLVQKLVVPDEQIPRGKIANRLRTFIAVLKKRKLV